MMLREVLKFHTFHTFLVPWSGGVGGFGEK